MIDGNARALLRRSSLVLALALAVVFVGLGGSASAALVGLQRFSPASTSNSANKSVTATCAAGKQLVGAGADVTPGDGDVLIDDIRPNAALTSLTVKAVEDQTGTTAPWFVQAFAVCTYPPPGLARVAATSATNSSNKAVTASCPVGKRLLGTGGEINSSNGQVLIDDLRPTNDLKGVIASAREDETGNSQNWSLTAYAICANPVAGLQRVSSQSANNSSASKVNQVSCPVGKQVVGGGGDINSSNGQVVADAFFPDAALTSYGSAAFEDDTGNPANWSLTTYAICANSAERVAEESQRSSVGLAFFGVECPPGHAMTGGGFEITGGLGQVWPLESAADPSRPAEFRTAAIEDDTGTSNSWSLAGYGICATPLPGLTVVEAESASSLATPKSALASCPAGTRVVGGGGSTFSAAEVPLKGIEPLGGLTSVEAVAEEGDEVPASGNWSVTAQAICAIPPPGLELVSRTSPSDSEETKTVTATCPGAKRLIGTGGAILSSRAVAVLDDLRPDAVLSSVTVTGFEDETGDPSNWSVSGYAICANP